MSQTNPKKLLFVCIGNMCRSPMAEGFARELGGAMIESYSAGTHPTGVVSEDSIELMGEIGIDISDQRSNGLEAVPVTEMDVIVSMAPMPAHVMVPPDFQGQSIDWNVDDPLARSLDTYRRVRDEIRARVEALLADL
jgi:arsenate reductase